MSAGITARALFLTPDKLVTAYSARSVQSLFRILYRNRMPKEVLQGKHHALGDTVAITFKLQLGPILA